MGAVAETSVVRPLVPSFGEVIVGTMSSSPPKKKSSGSSHRRDLRLHDGGGHDDRLRRATSTSLDVAPALHGQEGIIDVNPVPFQVRRDTDVDLPDDSVARGNIEIPEGRSRDRTTGGVESSTENNSRNDTDGAISMLTSIFNAKGYTRDQLLAVYKHQGRDLLSLILSAVNLRHPTLWWEICRM